MLQYLLKLVRPIYNIGTRHAQAIDVQNVRIVNSSGALAIFILMVYGSFFAILDYQNLKPLLQLYVVFSLGYLIGFYFSAIGFRMVSWAIFFSVGVINVGAATAFIGTGSGIHLIYIGLAATAFITTPTGYRVFQILLVVVSVVGFLASHFLFAQGIAPQYSDITMKILMGTSLISTVSLVILPIAVYHYRLIDANQKLERAFETISQSIDYAGRIQRSVLPNEAFFSNLFTDHFILWEPRDRVGGDIYWARRWGEGAVLVFGDCTGHGVPGAFMSLITTGAMERALKTGQVGKCGEFLQNIHQNVKHTLGQDGEDGESDDGMDLGVCYFHPDKKTMTFSGAKFDLFIVEDNRITTIKPTRKGIGYRRIPLDQTYDDHQIDLLPGRSFYLASDGMVEQVGGPKRLMFGKKRFKAMLLAMRRETMAEQKKSIYRRLLEYQGAQTRLDDVSIIGFKF